MDAGAMCMAGAVEKVHQVIDDAVSKGATVLTGGRPGPVQQQQQQPVNGLNTLAAQSPMRVTRRSAAAAAASHQGSGSSGSGATGQFYPPTVITGVVQGMDLYYQEVFGPVSSLRAIRTIMCWCYHCSAPFDTTAKIFKSLSTACWAGQHHLWTTIALIASAAAKISVLSCVVQITTVYPFNKDADSIEMFAKKCLNQTQNRPKLDQSRLAYVLFYCLNC